MPHLEEQNREALGAVLASGTFAKCQNLAKLLQFICEQCLEGRASELKEYSIGVEALGRSPNFDPATNSVVRVEVHRLREKLKRYYETEGFEDPVEISLQPGNYVPQFIRREAIVLAAPETKAAGSLKLQPVGMPEGLAGEVKPHARRRLILLCLAVIAGFAVAFPVFHIRSSPRSVATIARAFPGRAATGANFPSRAVRILAGYSKDQYIDRAGRVWQGDRYFRGGEAVERPREFFARTLDPTIFETVRSGDFAYDIPLGPGTYELRLYFSETLYGPDTIDGGGESSRLFNVTLNGQRVLDTFDILSDAAGQNVADVRVFSGVTPAADGRLHLQFQRQTSDPILNAIEVVPSEPGRMNPVRIVAQADSFTDHEGQVWSPDCYFEGGRLAARKAAVVNTTDPGLYYGERFGNFNYAIPAAPGKYRVTLSFAETYFGPDNPGGNAAHRLFNVYCNGVTLLRNFDPLKEAGGDNRAIQKTFRDIQPDAQGKIILRFVPVLNYACVNAIEVVEE